LFTLNLNPWAAFWLFFFTAATYINAGWLREQVCFYMCPYARFQSVMFDKDTMVVTYDYNRGEARGPRKKGVDPAELGLGDCIDCTMCVQVCPTGIDIRDGLQFECIQCAACIDACDEVMDKMGYERGLIRYTTAHNMAGQKTRVLRPRLIGYGAALAIMIGMFIVTLSNMAQVALDVHRDRNVLYREARGDRKSTRLNSSHVKISYAVFCLKKKKKKNDNKPTMSYVSYTTDVEPDNARAHEILNRD